MTKEFRAGLIESLSLADYHADPAWSASMLTRVGESIARFKYHQDHPESPSAAMEVGSATDLLLQTRLSGRHDLASAGIAVYDKGSSKTKGFEAFRLENRGRCCVDAEEYSLAVRCVDAIVGEPEAMDYLKGAVAQPSIFVTDPQWNLRRKCRPDFLHVKRGVSINVKTTRDCSEKGFFKAIADYAYDLQTVNYQDVLRLHFDRSFDEIHILVEKADEGPLRVAIRGIDDDTLDQARFQLSQIFAKIQECEKTGVWKDAPASLMVSTVPHWARTLVQS